MAGLVRNPYRRAVGSSCCVQNLGNQGFAQFIIAIAICIGEKTWVNNCGINQIRLFMLLIKALQGFIDAFPGSCGQLILILMDQIKMVLQAGIRPDHIGQLKGIM